MSIFTLASSRYVLDEPRVRPEVDDAVDPREVRTGVGFGVVVRGVRAAMAVPT